MQQMIKEEILGDRPIVLEEIRENDGNQPSSGNQDNSVKLSASLEKKTPQVNSQDEKNVYKKLAELASKNKRIGKSVTVDDIYEAFSDMDKLYVDAVLALIEQKGNIFIEQESKIILMT